MTVSEQKEFNRLKKVAREFDELNEDHREQLRLLDEIQAAVKHCQVAGFNQIGWRYEAAGFFLAEAFNEFYNIHQLGMPGGVYCIYRDTVFIAIKPQALKMLHKLGGKFLLVGLSNSEAESFKKYLTN